MYRFRNQGTGRKLVGITGSLTAVIAISLSFKNQVTVLFVIPAPLHRNATMDYIITAAGVAPPFWIECTVQ